LASAASSDFVDKVRSAVDVVALISESVPLKRAGRKFRGLCPFHAEKTPSFYLDDEKGLFYCFGCQTGGDVFKFVMLRENVEFLEAARLLARRAGIAIPEQRPGQRSERETILAAHREAAAYFHELLKSADEGAAARRYLRTRGTTGETVERLQMGFAADSWDGLRDHLVRRGFGVEPLVTGGLLSRKEGRSSTFDRFRGRVVFPIRNLSGEVVGFGGRLIGQGEPKYLNSADTPVYNKRETLYGLDLTRGAIRDTGEAIVVEGYFDFASLLQAGIGNVVATCGTSFTEQQALVLRRFADRVVMNYDPDAAGAMATRRSIDLLIALGFSVRVLRIASGQDPDEFVRAAGVDAYRALATQAPSHFDYLLEQAVAGRELDREIKSRVVKEMLPVIAKVPDRVERSGCINTMAERLALDDALLLSEIRDALLKEARPRVPGVRSPAPVRLTTAEGRLVRALVESVDLRAELLGQLPDDALAGSPIEAIVRAVHGLEAEGGDVSYGTLAELLDEPVRSELAMLAVEQAPAVGRTEALHCIESMRMRLLKRERDRLQKEMESATDASQLEELLRRKVELSREIDSLA